VETRIAAMKALENIGRPAAPALPAVAWALLDLSPRIRSEAARVLGRFGAEAQPFLPALRRRTTDPDSDVRKAASEAILNITSPPLGR
jgi:HEAT repeat protein